MTTVLAALVGLAGVAVALIWFMRANPSTLAKRLRFVLLGIAGLGAVVFLVFGLRFLPTLLPELMGLAGIVVAALIARVVRNRTAGGFSTPGTSQRTEARTAFFDAWIDHATGDVGATILQGGFTGRTLESLAEADLMALYAECSRDADSGRVLEAYLDRRLGADWRNARQPPRGPREDMTREEALTVLGLTAGASEEDIRAAHRRLIQRVHPDVGGSADLAARINRAKDILLGS